jgi:hypothetical protein
MPYSTVFLNRSGKISQTQTAVTFKIGISANEKRTYNAEIYISSYSSIDCTTLGGSWSVQQFYSTFLYLLLSLSNQ